MTFGETSMLVTWTRSQSILNKKFKTGPGFELELNLGGIQKEFENFDLIEGLR
jgi:hypothetical protein